MRDKTMTAKHPGAIVNATTLAQELDLPEELHTSTAPPPASGGAPHRDAALKRLRQTEPFNLDIALAEMEHAYIDAALSIAEGNVSQAARLLGVNRTTLYSRMESSSSNRSTNANSREP